MSKMTLSDLLSQKAAIDKLIAETQRAERSEAIAQIRTLMAQYGLDLADIGSKGGAATRTPKAAGTGAKVAAKYRNPATGDSWSGRGLKPKWLAAAIASGRSLSDFAV
jgi:DNA-binding protein H-NS